VNSLYYALHPVQFLRCQSMPIQRIGP